MTRVTVDTPDEYLEGVLVSMDDEEESMISMVMRTDEGDLIRVNLNVLTLDYGPDNSIHVYKHKRKKGKPCFR